MSFRILTKRKLRLHQCQGRWCVANRWQQLELGLGMLSTSHIRALLRLAVDRQARPVWALRVRQRHLLAKGMPRGCHSESQHPLRRLGDAAEALGQRGTECPRGVQPLPWSQACGHGGCRDGLLPLTGIPQLSPEGGALALGKLSRDWLGRSGWAGAQAGVGGTGT